MPRPDLGMPTLLETAAPEASAALARELGLDFVELNMNLPAFQPFARNAARLAALGEEYGLYYTLHLDERLDVADFNPEVAAAHLRSVQRAVELARELGAPVLNMHLPTGVFFTLPEGKRYLYEEYSPHYLAAMERFRDACDRWVGQSGVRICVENCGGFLPVQQRALSCLLESPAFALTLDTGHLHRAGVADLPLLRRHADRLCHLHLHDAQGGRDHLPPGTGEADLSAALEVKTAEGLRRSVQWLRQQKILW